MLTLVYYHMRYVNDELGRMCDEVVVVSFKVISNIYLVGLRKTTNILAEVWNGHFLKVSQAHARIKELSPTIGTLSIHP